MIIGLDVETDGLDATKFLMAAIAKPNGEPEVFMSRAELWKRLRELADKEEERKRVLTIYSHNAAFDTASYVDFNDPKMVYYCEQPFIWERKGKERVQMRLLDTMNFFKMTLKELGAKVGLQKLQMPDELKQGRTDMAGIEYMKRDAEICLRTVMKLKETLAAQGVKPKRMSTISQIAKGYMFKKVLQGNLFWGVMDAKGRTHEPLNPEETHMAYRAARMEAFGLGEFRDVWGADVNSLYPYALSKMPFPDLRTEEYVERPLDYISQGGLLSTIGVTKALMANRRDKLGMLGIRDEEEGDTYYPREGSIAIGAWANDELNEAVRRGWEMLDAEWSVLFREGSNPFHEPVMELYEKKRVADTWERELYKQILNHSIGKMAQRAKLSETVIRPSMQADELINQGWRIERGIGTSFMFKRELATKRKWHYAPIIPVLVNSFSRVFMNKIMRAIGDNLLYTDTDSVYFTGAEDMKLIDLGPGIGQWKTVCAGEKMLIYGKKTYKAGGRMKVCGLSHKGEEGDFEKGTIQGARMVTLRNAESLEEIGRFRQETRDLREQLEKERERLADKREQRVFVDKMCGSTEHFVRSGSLEAAAKGLNIRTAHIE